MVEDVEIIDSYYNEKSNNISNYLMNNANKVLYYFFFIKEKFILKL